MRRREHLAPRLRTLRGRKGPQIEPAPLAATGPPLSMLAPAYALADRRGPVSAAPVAGESLAVDPPSSTAASDQRAAAPLKDETFAASLPQPSGKPASAALVRPSCWQAKDGEVVGR
jgi:hypothetical protein